MSCKGSGPLLPSLETEELDGEIAGKLKAPKRVQCDPPRKGPSFVPDRISEVIKQKPERSSMNNKHHENSKCCPHPCRGKQ
ncbi:hypothetical protein VTL71DRAFT_14325 [Oculimacula yallundae]|uniref:Uncharacterized protein n=1 Tax=Oculimacula yallundae TaxID=86028 RepID=A0ABR4CK93_9HELO